MYSVPSLSICRNFTSDCWSCLSLVTLIQGALGVSNFGAAQLEGMRSLVAIGPESAEMSRLFLR